MLPPGNCHGHQALSWILLCACFVTAQARARIGQIFHFAALLRPPFLDRFEQALHIEQSLNGNFDDKFACKVFKFVSGQEWSIASASDLIQDGAHDHFPTHVRSISEVMSESIMCP